MTSFLVGIIVLIAVTLAVSKSLVADRSRGEAETDRDHDEDRGASRHTEPDALPLPRTRKTAGPSANATVDDFVLQDAVEEDEYLTGVWED